MASRDLRLQTSTMKVIEETLKLLGRCLIIFILVSQNSTQTRI